MGAITVAVMMIFSTLILAIPLMLLGSLLLIMYFSKRFREPKPKKVGFILPFIIICVGEVIASPACALIILIRLNTFSNIFVEVVKACWLLLLFVGIISLAVCAVRIALKKRVGNIMLCVSAISFFVGFLFIPILGCFHILATM